MFSYPFQPNKALYFGQPSCTLIVWIAVGFGFGLYCNKTLIWSNCNLLVTDIMHDNMCMCVLGDLDGNWRRVLVMNRLCHPETGEMLDVSIAALYVKLLCQINLSCLWNNDPRVHITSNRLLRRAQSKSVRKIVRTYFCSVMNKSKPNVMYSSLSSLPICMMRILVKIQVCHQGLLLDSI